MQWLPLSRHTAQTSLGTTRFFLSIHLPHLSCMIPCSYWALTWVAVLPTCMTSYEISVRQTRDLPVSWYIPHIQLPSDSISRWTPLLFSYTLPTIWACSRLSPVRARPWRAIMTTSSAGGFLCGYKPVVLAGSKEPLKIRHAHSYHRQALKGFSLCLVYWLTRKRVYVLFQ